MLQNQPVKLSSEIKQLVWMAELGITESKKYL